MVSRYRRIASSESVPPALPVTSRHGKASILVALVGVFALLTAVAPASATPSPGPDDFGYRATEIAENMRTVSGAEIVNCDDCVSGATAIGFPFSFYGTDYTDVYISSNGFLSFLSGVSQGCCGGNPIPVDDDVDGAVIGFWTDLWPAGTGSVRTQTLGVAPDREFVVDFDQVDYCCGDSSTDVDFQMILHENSDIELQYGEMDDSGRTSTVGIEDPAGTVGLQISNGTTTTSLVVHRGFLISSRPTATPPATYWFDLNVAKAGTGSGTVTGDTYLGIECGSDCSSHLAQWTYGVLTATPDTGSESSGWSGPCLATGGPPDQCTVHLAWNQSYTASFTTSEPPPPPAECADGVDNDGDGLTDFPADLGCADSAADDESSDSKPEAPSITGHARSVTIAALDRVNEGGRNYMVFQGVLEALDGYAPCYSDQGITLQRRTKGVWRDGRATSTDASGAFTLSRKERKGRYRVVAASVLLGGDAPTDECLEAFSEELVHNLR